MFAFVTEGRISSRFFTSTLILKLRVTTYNLVSIAIADST